MESSQPIRLRVITPEKTVYNEIVNHVVIPAVNGKAGIFRHHAPFMSYIKPGRLQIHLQDKRIICVTINSGLFEFKDDSVIIFTKEEISQEDFLVEDKKDGDNNQGIE